MDTRTRIEVDIAFDKWTNTFGNHSSVIREDAFNALVAAKNDYAEGDPKLKKEIDVYVASRLDKFLG